MGHSNPHRAALFAGFILKEFKSTGSLGDVPGGCLSLMPRPGRDSLQEELGGAEGKSAQPPEAAR